MLRCAIGAVVCCAATSLGAGDWPGWRGPDGTGVSSETGLTLQWDAERNVAWKTAIPGRGHSSPIAWGGHVCLHARTGEVRHQGGRMPKAATFLASPIAVDVVILLPSLDGDTFALKAGAEHEVIGVNSLDESSYASPAVASRRIYLRAESHLFAIAAPAP